MSNPFGDGIDLTGGVSADDVFAKNKDVPVSRLRDLSETIELHMEKASAPEAVSRLDSVNKKVEELIETYE